MPGDYDIEYASPWAGANYIPISSEGTIAAEWDRNTWPELEKIARYHPEAGVHFQGFKFALPGLPQLLTYSETARYVRSQDMNADKDTRTASFLQAESWYKHVVPNYRQLQADECPPGYTSGNAFTSVCINTSIYLPWLVSQCLKAGVVFKRGMFNHISEAAPAHHTGRLANVVMNCTGLSARKLGGVMDENMIPARGQTVLVRNEPNIMCDVSGTSEGDEEVCYVMQRAAGGGTLLGGSYQKGNWDSQIDPNLAIRIMKRAIEVCPSLTGGKGIEHLSIIRQGVGLRPVRIGGTRLENERVDGMWVVHNYGHGGYGYQSSYGCSQAAVGLVAEALAAKAKL
ncbi:MAG: hypothetical protein Q9164_004175 [Protoblastenia rupestris]